MKKEKRLDLIDRKALIKAAEKKKFAIADNTHPYKAVEIVGKYFREVVDNAPAVDAVEVMRCKECKYWDKIGVCDLHTEVNAVWMDAEDFCSKAERRTDG